MASPQLSQVVPVPGERPAGAQRVARIAWVSAALLSVVILLLSIPGYRQMPLGVWEGHLTFEPTRLIMLLRRLTALTSFLSALMSIFLAALLFTRRRSDRMGLYLSFYLLAYGILLAGPIELLQPIWPRVPQVNSFILLPILVGPATVALVAMFPDGRFVPSWSRWIVIFGFVALPLTTLAQRYGQGATITGPGALIIAGAVFGTLTPVGVMIYAQVYRYRFVSTPEQRQQTKWVLFGMALWITLMLLSSIPWTIALRFPLGTTFPWWLAVTELVWVSSTLFLPITLTVAVMRYRLFEVDRIINRTLGYTTLTTVVLALYVLLVGLAGLLFRSSDRTVVAILATGLVALFVHPLRQRLQQVVNRLMYGERDEPLTLISRLGRQLEAAMGPDETLTTITETVARALKLPYVAVALRYGEGFESVATYGLPVTGTTTFPLLHRGEQIGHLIVASRPAEERLSDTDQRLLRNIARQAGPAVHAMRLTAELQRSQRRLVTVQEEERRRLRRDLHDGLGPQLASQMLTIDAIERLLDRDPQEAAVLLADLKAQSRDALEDVRRVVYELRPPALDELGLAGALREAAVTHATGPTMIEIEHSAPLPALPAAVEVAAYRIAREAMVNVVRHASATRCRISIEVDARSPVLRLTIEDDGRGLPEHCRSGVGLQSMRERATELGGRLSVGPRPGRGTRVAASLPLTVPR